jgi:hypothetical protein
MHLAPATAAATATATAMAPLRDMKHGKTRSRKDQAETNVLLVKSNGYERGVAAQRINKETGHKGCDFDPYVLDM